MDIREIFARNLRRLWHQKGLSQEELAYEADINRTYISKLETAASYAGLEIVEKIASVLDVPPAHLLNLPGRRNKR